MKHLWQTWDSWENKEEKEVEKQEKEEEVIKEINTGSENNTVIQNTMDVETQPENNSEGELELVEINLDAPQEFDPGFEKMKLQNANEVYYKMYKEAKERKMIYGKCFFNNKNSKMNFVSKNRFLEEFLILISGEIYCKYNEIDIR